MPTKKRCPFPNKQKHTQAEAKARAAALHRNAAVGYIQAYRCPAGGHYHVGHPPRRR